MKITASNLQLASTHDAVQRQEKREHLQYWQDGRAPLERHGGTMDTAWRGLVEGSRSKHHSQNVQISHRAAALQPQPRILDADSNSVSEDEPLADVETSLIKILVEHITGRRFDLFRPSSLRPSSEAAAMPTPPSAESSTASVADNKNETVGWGLKYDYYESRYESEATTFTAQGTVKTTDGQEVAIQVNLNMSRTFFSEQSLSVRAGDALKDPLVLNFAGNSTALTQTRFDFDLDHDGRSEQIAFVSPNSGFLALDHNQDKVINDGSELFGPTSGDGFSELAAADIDSNGWIDENDPIYDRLRIWSRDAEGHDQLVGLGQQGVGAIYLGRINTPFQLKGADNGLLGQIRSTGLFLGESGNAGTVQQIDLRV